jgi:hypothetical protein
MIQNTRQTIRLLVIALRANQHSIKLVRVDQNLLHQRPVAYGMYQLACPMLDIGVGVRINTSSRCRGLAWVTVDF